MSTVSAPLQPKSAIHSLPPHMRPVTAGPSRKNMSITQTYYLAHKARGKLSREAAQPDHDLRLLVGHANLLDSLMFELAEAEREQERWFNQSVRGAASNNKLAAADKRHIQWADRVVEEAITEEDEEEYDSDSSSDSDDSDFDYYEEEEENDNKPVAPASPMMVQHDDFDDDEEEDEEEDYAQLELVRTPSHSGSPPELTIDHDTDSSDDESMPPSPADSTLHLPDKEAKKEEQVFGEEEMYSSRPNPTGLVSAILVY